MWSFRSASEEEIIAAMRTVWERMKIIIEPCSAVAIAPLLKPGTVATLDLPPRPDAAPPKLGPGGNVDLDLSSLPFCTGSNRVTCSNPTSHC